MIELHTLGTLGLRAPEAPRASEAYARPKPLGLLAYLAIARPRGFQSQNSILAVFWPESDAMRAQQSLRQALHILRKALGEDVIVRRGRAEIGINTEIIRSDVCRFETAMAAGEFEEALGLYHGEFLAGFYIHDAPEFEHWVSNEQLRLHGQAVIAVRALIDRCDAEGSTDAAAMWARRWAELSPTDESAVQFAMARQLATGDHGSALRTYNRLERALVVDGDEPSEESAKLANEARDRLATSASRIVLRSQIAQPDSTVAASGNVPPQPTADPIRPGEVDRPQSSLPRRRTARAGRWIAALAAASIALAVVAVGPRRIVSLATGRDVPSTSAITRVAILPFTVRGTERIAYLREGMVDLLAGKLDNADGITTVNAGSVLAYERANGAITNDPHSATTIAHELNAGQFVLGTVVEVGGHVAINASLYNANGTLRASSEGSAVDESQILPAIDKVARELLASEFSGATARLEHVAATTTTSLAALKAFLDGERAVRAGQQTVAADAFQRAVHEDSTFALAHYRLSTTVLWSAQPTVVQHSIEAAERFSNKLPQHERLALEARGMIGRGAVEDADRLYHDIVAKYPDDIDAWNQLGESLFHTGPWRGRPVSESRAAFEQVLTMRADDGNALLHLARIATLEQRAADVVALTDRALAQNPEREAVLELRGLRAVATKNSVERQQLLDTIRATSHVTGAGDEARLLAWRIATYSDNPDEGSAIIGALSDDHNSAHLQLLSHSALAHMNAARGRWSTARHELDAMERMDARFAAETRANLALAWPASLTAAERARAMRILATNDDALSHETSTELDSMSRARGHYLAGTLALIGGDTLFARAQQRALVALSKENNADADMAQHLEHELAARILWRSGNAAAALREVEAGWPTGSPRAALPYFQGDVYTLAHERYLRGELLMALGRNAEAQRWFETVADDQGESLMLSARVHIALGQLAEKRGAELVAIAQYQHALSLWANADADVLTAMRTTETKLQEMLDRQRHANVAHALVGDTP